MSRRHRKKERKEERKKEKKKKKKEARKKERKEEVEGGAFPQILLNSDPLKELCSSFQFSFFNFSIFHFFISPDHYFGDLQYITTYISTGVKVLQIQLLAKVASKYVESYHQPH